MVGQHSSRAALVTALILFSAFVLVHPSTSVLSVLPAPSTASPLNETSPYIVAPGGSFSVPFSLINANDTYMEVEADVEGLSSSFQPRIYLNGTEGDSVSVPPGAALPCAATIQAPWQAISGTFRGNVTVSTQEAGWSVPFVVEIAVPALEISMNGPVRFDGSYACVEGCLANPTRVDAIGVVLTLAVDGRTAVEQGYAKVAAGKNVTFKLVWPAGGGQRSVVLSVESRNGASDSEEASYFIEGDSGINRDLIILVGGILALLFPVIVLAQMGIQRRRERKALERRERERALSSSLLTIKEGDR